MCLADDPGQVELLPDVPAAAGVGGRGGVQLPGRADRASLPDPPHQRLVHQCIRVVFVVSGSL